MQIRVWGDPVLRQPAAPVEAIDDTLLALVDDMLQTMYDAPGVGLAAQQVGVLQQVFVFDVGEGPGVLLNPEIVETSGEWTYEEGCLSVPGLFFSITRPEEVHIRGLDIDGNEINYEGHELLGRMFQHEVDHLHGTVLLDRLDKATRKQAMRALRERAMAQG
ncbi:MAG TPA: peptide deformylase [Acidimicrobiia bacterium]|nr:peptide deformylase [Acidimicrobiia bacterium]